MVSIKIAVCYNDDVARVYPEDIAGNLNPDATDDQIDREFRRYLDEAVSDGPWPSYQVRDGDAAEVIAAVRALLNEAKEGDE